MDPILNSLDILRVSADKELISELKTFLEQTKERRCKRPRDLEFYRIKSANLLASYDDKWVYVYRDKHFYRYQLDPKTKELFEAILGI